jgi:two-component system cell cycle sensor histidine kinase/response regulator CckA
MGNDHLMSRAPELFRSLFEEASDATVITDAGGQVLQRNRAARELNAADMDRLFPRADATDSELAPFWQELRARGQASTDLRLGATGQAVRHLMVEGSAHGELFVVVLRDVTERRALEAELRHLRRVESFGYLTASLVHDFNNLLTPIVFLSAALVEEVAEGSAAATLAEELEVVAKRAVSLVRKMRSFVRRETCAPTPVNLSAAITEMQPLLAGVAGEGIEIVLALDDALEATTIDCEQLEHVLLNIVANARDAMPSGGRLTVSTSNVEIDEVVCQALGCPAAGAYVALSVTDEGVGMPSHVRERIFERFFTTKAADSGTGLGLATAHTFVLQSGGGIAVRSQPGEGTTVTIYLPRAAAPAPQSGRPRRIGTPLPRGNETILIVENDVHVRGVMRVILEEQGYFVLEAASGDEALEVAASHAEIDLFLVDLVMPRMNGRELVARLRAMGHTVNVLFTSGHTDRVIAEHGLRECEALLRKAFSPAELAHGVRGALDVARQAKTAQGC